MKPAVKAALLLAIVSTLSMASIYAVVEYHQFQASQKLRRYLMVNKSSFTLPIAYEGDEGNHTELGVFTFRNWDATSKMLNVTLLSFNGTTLYDVFRIYVTTTPGYTPTTPFINALSPLVVSISVPAGVEQSCNIIVNYKVKDVLPGSEFEVVASFTLGVNY